MAGLERRLRGRRRLAVALARPLDQLLARALERLFANLDDVVREVLAHHPLQERAIRPRRDLVQRHAGVLAEADYDRLAVPAEVARRADPARAIRERIADARDLLPVLIGELEVLEHADQHAPGRGDIRARRVRRCELVADEPAVRVLQAARLALLPQPERIDDLLVREIERLAIDARELGLEHLDVERDVVANDHVRRGEHLDDLIRVLAELRTAREILERDAVNGLRGWMDRHARPDPPGPALRLLAEPVLDAQLDHLILLEVDPRGLAVEDHDAWLGGTLVRRWRRSPIQQRQGHRGTSHIPELRFALCLLLRACVVGPS